jgi:hypothetical protein
VQRVAVIGCGGSGKTTISHRVADAIGTTITHLDAVYYDDEWNTLAPDKFAAVQPTYHLHVPAGGLDVDPTVRITQVAGDLLVLVESGVHRARVQRPVTA